MDKAPDAFRTISEVAEALETPAHVLRFWESRFPQIKPVKRAGGRRYYRPADVALLSGIRHLLHSDGMTIRGVQKVLREQGVRHVASLGGVDISEIDLEAEDTLAEVELDPAPSAQVVPIGGPPRRTSAPAGVPVAPSQPIPNPAPPVQTDPGQPVPDPASRNRSADIQPLFPAEPATPPAQTSGPATAAKALDANVPRDGDGGFIAFSNPRGPRPRQRPTDPEAQAVLPLSLDPAPGDTPDPAPLWADPAETAPPQSPDDAAAEQDHNALTADAAPHDLPQHRAPDTAPPEDYLPEDGMAYDAEPEDLAPEDSLPEDALPEDLSPQDWPPEDLEQSPLGDAAQSPETPPTQTRADVPDPTLGSEQGSTEADALTADAAMPTPAHDPAALPDPASPDPAALPVLAGLATRLRHLSVSPQVRPALEDLQARLGLLHAQMAEALRLRR